MENTTNEEKNKLSEDVINIHWKFAMVAGAMPIPIVDVALVTGVQLDMLSKIADIYGVDFNRERGKSIALALVGTSVGRLGASAIKAIPGVGTVLGISSQVIISGATTYAVGKVFQEHFKSSGNLEDFDVNKMEPEFTKFFKIGKEKTKEAKDDESADDILKTIEQLKTLKENGTITESEYQKAKEELLKKLQN